MFVFHVNLTRTSRVPLDRPALVEALRARGITVRNAQLTDISKRWVHELCARAAAPAPVATRDGDPDERLLVKTNYNYHGRREAELTVAQREMLGYDAPHDVPNRQDTQYRLVPRREVPDAVWTSPHWVVERYIANAAHRFHRVYISGDAMVVSRVFDPSTFKKMPEGIDRESVYLTVSDAVRTSAAPDDMTAVGALCARVARAADVDYGAIDVVSDDHGTYYVIDINTTPHWGDGGHPTLLAYLGTGLAGECHAR
jgi:hypothetical protein